MPQTKKLEMKRLPLSKWALRQTTRRMREASMMEEMVRESEGAERLARQLQDGLADADEETLTATATAAVMSGAPIVGDAAVALVNAYAAKNTKRRQDLQSINSLFEIAKWHPECTSKDQHAIGDVVYSSLLHMRDTARLELGAYANYAHESQVVDGFGCPTVCPATLDDMCYSMMHFKPSEVDIESRLRDLFPTLMPFEGLSSEARNPRTGKKERIWDKQKIKNLKNLDRDGGSIVAMLAELTDRTILSRCVDIATQQLPKSWKLATEMLDNGEPWQWRGLAKVLDHLHWWNYSDINHKMEPSLVRSFILNQLQRVEKTGIDATFEYTNRTGTGKAVMPRMTIQLGVFTESNWYERLLETISFLHPESHLNWTVWIDKHDTAVKGTLLVAFGEEEVSKVADCDYESMIAHQVGKLGMVPKPRLESPGASAELSLPRLQLLLGAAQDAAKGLGSLLIVNIVMKHLCKHIGSILHSESVAMELAHYFFGDWRAAADFFMLTKSIPMWESLRWWLVVTNLMMTNGLNNELPLEIEELIQECQPWHGCCPLIYSSAAALLVQHAAMFKAEDSLAWLIHNLGHHGLVYAACSNPMERSLACNETNPPTALFKLLAQQPDHEQMCDLLLSGLWMTTNGNLEVGLGESDKNCFSGKTEEKPQPPSDELEALAVNELLTRMPEGRAHEFTTETLMGYEETCRDLKRVASQKVAVSDGYGFLLEKMGHAHKEVKKEIEFRHKMLENEDEKRRKQAKADKSAERERALTQTAIAAAEQALASATELFAKWQATGRAVYFKTLADKIKAVNKLHGTVLATRDPALRARLISQRDEWRACYDDLSTRGAALVAAAVRLKNKRARFPAFAMLLHHYAIDEAKLLYKTEVDGERTYRRPSPPAPQQTTPAAAAAVAPAVKLSKNQKAAARKKEREQQRLVDVAQKREAEKQAQMRVAQEKKLETARRCKAELAAKRELRNHEQARFEEDEARRVREQATRHTPRSGWLSTHAPAWSSAVTPATPATPVTPVTPVTDSSSTVVVPLAAFRAPDNDDTASTVAGDVQCVICWERRKTHLNTGCGHQCVCSKCADSMPKGSACPVCRKPVEKWIKVFV